MSEVMGVRDTDDRRQNDPRAVLAASVANYADALTEVVGGLFAAAGVDPEHAARALERGAARVRRGEASLTVDDREPWLQLSDALAVWWRDPAYLDEQGRARPLPDRGPAPSLESLFARTVDAPLRARARELLRRTSAEERGGLWYCVHEKGALRVGGLEGVHRLRMQLAGLTRTYIDSQLRPNDAPQLKNFDVAAHVSALPESAVPELRLKLSIRLQALLEDIDFWLTTTAEQHKEGPVVQVGVTAFMYTSPPRARVTEDPSVDASAAATDPHVARHAPTPREET